MSKRGLNFSHHEVKILISFIKEHVDILENKKTDLITNTKKREVWEKIVEEFNVVPGTNPRDINMLKSKYENMKKALKKKNANVKFHITGNGEGPPIFNEKELEYEDELREILESQKTGQSTYCDDSPILKEEASDFEEIPSTLEKTDRSTYNPNILKQTIFTPLKRSVKRKFVSTRDNLSKFTRQKAQYASLQQKQLQQTMQLQLEEHQFKFEMHNLAMKHMQEMHELKILHMEELHEKKMNRR